MMLQLCQKPWRKEGAESKKVIEKLRKIIEKEDAVVVIIIFSSLLLLFKKVCLKRWEKINSYKFRNFVSCSRKFKKVRVKFSLEI